MDEISTIGLDIAKKVFQVHGVDAGGAVVVRRQLRRAELLKFFGSLPACTVGLEACATSHHWARQIATLGHTVNTRHDTYCTNLDGAGQLFARREMRRDCTARMSLMRACHPKPSVATAYGRA